MLLCVRCPAGVMRGVAGARPSVFRDLHSSSIARPFSGS